MADISLVLVKYWSSFLPRHLHFKVHVLGFGLKIIGLSHCYSLQLGGIIFQPTILSYSVHSELFSIECK